MELNTLSGMEQQIITSMNTMFELDCERNEQRLIDCGWCDFYGITFSGGTPDPERLVALGLAERRDHAHYESYVYRLTLAGFAVAAELKVEVE